MNYGSALLSTGAHVRGHAKVEELCSIARWNRVRFHTKRNQKQKAKQNSYLPIIFPERTEGAL